MPANAVRRRGLLLPSDLSLLLVLLDVVPLRVDPILETSFGFAAEDRSLQMNEGDGTNGEADDEGERADDEEEAVLVLEDVAALLVVAHAGVVAHGSAVVPS